MSRDSSLFVRRAVLRALKGSEAVRALVPADRIYPQQRPPNPTWPFIAYGAPVIDPFLATGLDGSALSVAIHAYAETSGELVTGVTHSDDTGFDDDSTYATDETQPGEDMAHRILSAIAALFGEDGVELSLEGTGCPYPATAHVTWRQSQVVQDGGDASAFHGFATLDITVSS